MTRKYSDFLYVLLRPESLVRTEFIPAEQRVALRFRAAEGTGTLVLAADLADLARVVRLLEAALAEAGARGYEVDVNTRKVTKAGVPSEPPAAATGPKRPRPRSMFGQDGGSRTT
ncbi:MAG: hypothetical protein M3Q39_07095 [Actinomycetota bacterium]|nr:hypothetical protein [Actinomycetota bacterium]